MTEGLRQFWALGIALCVSVLVSVSAFVFVLQRDMDFTRAEFANAASVSATVGGSYLTRLFTLLIAIANVRSDWKESNGTFLDLLATTELLPMINMICEQKGRDIGLLHVALDDKTEASCSPDDYRPISMNVKQASRLVQADLLISQSEIRTEATAASTPRDRIGATIILRVYLGEQHSILYVLDSLALLNVFFPDQRAFGIARGEFCLFLIANEGFAPIACKDTSTRTRDMASLLPAESKPLKKELLDIDVYGLNWQVFSRPDAAEINKNLSTSPLYVFAAIAIVYGLICWFVFRFADKAVRLNEQNHQLADLLSQLEQQNRDLDQFAVMAAHDLQAPLRFMVTRAHFLDEEIQELQRPDLQEHSTTIIEQGLRMQALILDLLAFCRAGQDEISFESVDVRQLICEQIDRLMKTEDCHQTQITVGQLPDTLRTDRDKLAQIISQLLANAIKFSRNNASAHVTINAKYAQDHDVWNFSVEDNGCGINLADHTSVFRPFTRLDPATEGTGIGLAIAKKIITRLQGRIWIDSDFRGGARFCFTLPALQKDATA